MTKNPWERGLPQLQHKVRADRLLRAVGQGAVWYSGQFWSLYFLQQVSKMDPLTTGYIVEPRG
jgi:hypothetical protein